MMLIPLIFIYLYCKWKISIVVVTVFWAAKSNICMGLRSCRHQAWPLPMTYLWPEGPVRQALYWCLAAYRLILGPALHNQLASRQGPWHSRTDGLRLEISGFRLAGEQQNLLSKAIFWACFSTKWHCFRGRTGFLLICSRYLARGTPESRSEARVSLLWSTVRNSSKEFDPFDGFRWRRPWKSDRLWIRWLLVVQLR